MAKFKLLPIRDFAELTGLKTSTLRYYDRLGLFLPARKASNGYRYYLPSQLMTINMIDVLSEVGAPIEEVTQQAINRSPEKISKLFQGYEKELSDRMAKLTNSYEIVNTYRKLIDMGSNVTLDEVSVTYRNEVRMNLGDSIDFGDDTTYYTGFMGFLSSAKEKEINLSYPIGGYFKDITSFVNMPSRPDRFFSYDPNGREAIPAGNYMTYYTKCDYGEITDATIKLKEHAEKNGYTFVGPVYNLWIHDEVSVANPNNYLLEVRVAVRS